MNDLLELQVKVKISKHLKLIAKLRSGSNFEHIKRKNKLKMREV